MKLSAVCLVLCACVEPPMVEESTLALGSSPGGDDGCPVWGCGGNSPVIDAVGFHDLHELGIDNAQGFGVVAFEKHTGSAWVKFRADVIDGELVARHLRTNGIAYSGPALIGARFEIYNRVTSRSYYLIVQGMSRVPMWATGTTGPQTARAYKLGWIHKLSPVDVKTICGHAAENDGIDEFHAVLFDDDRIDAEGIVVGPEEVNWFNIGCRGHALAKQHLTGHTRAAGTILGISTTTNERTAHLKLLAADYCGLGHPFTVAGQPLGWRDQYNRFDNIPGQGGQIEARWTEQGATCLNVPRVDFNQTQLGLDTFPAGVEPLLGTSEGWCTAQNPRPPPCTGSIGDMQQAHVISVNY
jgi:hypothetical protein